MGTNNLIILIASLFSGAMALLEMIRRNKANVLLKRANSLIACFDNRPFDLLSKYKGKLLLTSSSILERVESKIRFVEKEMKVDIRLDLAKPIKPFGQRFRDLEKRTAHLEQIR